MNAAPYQIVIGLEVHVQLLSDTKLFCRCSTRFGGAPNSQTCPVCLGLPGSLPVLNRRAVELAWRAGAALNCVLPRFSKWDRKNYFYPDLPKGYQISQFDLPLAIDGWLDIDAEPGTKRVRLIRAHLEEDAGKSMHDEEDGVADSRIDLNRAGTPLLEIVSHPDLRSPSEAKSYLSELKLLLMYLNVSDCNMQEGSLRVDANVNLHLPRGEAVIETPIVEIKNMNSFRAVERALTHEAERQFAQWTNDGLTKQDAPKQTRGWDEHAEVTRLQRQKEESSDYRYFPDPDLPPVILSEQQRGQVVAEIGELPANLRRRLQKQYQIDAYSADVIVQQGRNLAAYFEETARISGDWRRANNWVQQDVLRVLGEQGWTIDQFPVSAERLAELVKLISDDRLDTTRAKVVFQRMLERRETASQAMAALGVGEVDQSELDQMCMKILQRHENTQAIADFRAGKQQAIGALIGQAKKEQPNANPAALRAILIKQIAKLPPT